MIQISLTKTQKISIVIPVFAGEGRIGKLMEAIVSFFQKTESDFEIICVDDGSEDNSRIELTQAKTKFNERIKVVFLASNFGQHNATLCGLNKANGDLIITMDEDFENVEKGLEALIDAYNKSNAQVVYGISGKIRHGFLRKMGTWVHRIVTRKWTSNFESGSSFRLMEKELVKNICSLHNQNFVFLDTILSWHTKNILFEKLDFPVSETRKSSYNVSSLVFLVFDLALAYTAIPLRIMTSLGLLFSILTFVAGIYFIAKKVFWNQQIGFTPVIVSVLFSASIIVLCLGIIGEYIRRIYTEILKKPQYVIREEL